MPFRLFNTPSNLLQRIIITYLNVYKLFIGTILYAFAHFSALAGFCFCTSCLFLTYVMNMIMMFDVTVSENLF